MKKFIFTAIAVIFLFLFTGCNNSDNYIHNPVPEHEQKVPVRILHANQSTADQEPSWIIKKNLNYSYGKFYCHNSLLFSFSEYDKTISETEVRLLGCSTNSSGTNFITAKYFNKIWLIKEKDFKFTVTLLTENATPYFEERYCSNHSSDKFFHFYNEDAIQYNRTIIYRSKDGNLMQINFKDESIIEKVLIENDENINLVFDEEGIYWITENDLNTLSFSELVLKYRNNNSSPTDYIDNNGKLLKYDFGPN